MHSAQPHLSTGDRIAIAVAALAASVAIGVVAFEHAYPDATTATWRLILLACVIVGAGAIFYLAFNLVFRPRVSEKLGRGQKPTKSDQTDMSVNLGSLGDIDLAPNVAIAAAIAASIAVFFKPRMLPIAFALLAIAAVAYDELTIPRRNEINPIPGGAGITLNGDLDAPDGLTIADFTKSWGIFSLVVKVDDVTQRYDYDREAVAQMLKREEINFDQMPRVTLKKPQPPSFVPGTPETNFSPDSAK